LGQTYFFRESKAEAKCGDRAAICVTQFDSKKVERGLLSSTNLKPISRVVCKIHRVKLFREKIKSKTKFNITVGHQTCSANISLFEQFETTGQSELDFDSPQCYDGFKFRYVDEMKDESDSVLAVLEFDKGMYFLPNGLIIGSRLELDANAKHCRIAFSAQLTKSSFVCPEKLLVLKEKEKTGQIERLHDERTLIVKNLFKKETNIEIFNRMKVELSNGETGIIDGTFGTTGKIKILNMDGFSESIQTRYRKLKKGEKREDHNQDGISIKLKFFKNIHSKDKNSILQF